jgi:hypothetical protein
MSACFRRGDNLNDRDTEWEREKEFRAEILKLKHDPTLIDTNRFYNVVSREKVSGSGDKESIISWSDLPKPAPAPTAATAAAPNAPTAAAQASGTPGGKSRRKRRNRKNRRKTRK